MDTFKIAEDVLLDLSRIQREADKFTRWHLELLDAGVDPDEAVLVMADIINPQLERAAA